ncbi:MAG: nucleotidyl transferase AbiEii/AbiGii toxin family protein [Labilithrix sp.]|nr:nucleotidyl transferase AbiEii/AbiGii toxin family protein [Labilithrix sp.]
MPPSPRQAVELFHLVFLRALVARGEDKSLIALKGGCNLRFYFGSVRYSEGLDLDVVVIAKETLKNKVDRLLRSPAVTAPLAARGIELVELSAPKQTDTTQRWKAGLRVGLAAPVRTKIELSRRRGQRTIEGAAFEAMSAEVSRPHGLSPFPATHYTAESAIRQKVHALAGRVAPQARDVFDLDLLLARPEVERLALDAEHKTFLPDALSNAMSLSFDDYASQVVAYLDPVQAAVFEGRAAWETMQENVVSRLEALG